MVNAQYQFLFQGKLYIALDNQYLPALEGLEGFSHIQVYWGFSSCDNDVTRTKRPCTHCPSVLGTFATRSPERPNPVALSCRFIVLGAIPAVFRRVA